MFSIVWKLIILYLCESNIEFYMRVKEIPILLLTGYLGSGKTTLVNHILSNKRGIKFAVIGNNLFGCIFYFILRSVMFVFEPLK